MMILEIEMLKDICLDVRVCGICLKSKGNLEGHVCKDCLKISPRRLPVVSIGNGKIYFFDKRLRELRNVENPCDYIKLFRGHYDG